MLFIDFLKNRYEEIGDGASRGADKFEDIYDAFDQYKFYPSHAIELMNTYGEEITEAALGYINQYGAKNINDICDFVGAAIDYYIEYCFGDFEEIYATM